MKTDECVLFSGAANGAESEFGAAAERRGIELDGHVCSALRRLADDLQLAIPPALVEIASASARAEGTRTW